jgi:uncharacterized protein
MNKNLELTMRHAVSMEDLGMMRQCLEDGIDVNFITPFGSWLHIAAKRSRISSMKFLIESGADINLKCGTFNGSPLNIACGYGSVDCVKFLISQGANFDYDEPEKNPLFSAIHGGNIEIVKVLIDHGVNLMISYNGKSMKDVDAYEFAMERGCFEIGKLINENLPNKRMHRTS